MQELFYNRSELEDALKVGGDTRSVFDVEAYRSALNEIQLFRKKDRHRKQESAVLSFEDKKFFEVGKEYIVGEVKDALFEVQDDFEELLKISNEYNRVRVLVDTQEKLFFKNDVNVSTLDLKDITLNGINLVENVNQDRLLFGNVTDYQAYKERIISTLQNHSTLVRLLVDFVLESFDVKICSSESIDLSLSVESHDIAEFLEKMSAVYPVLETAVLDRGKKVAQNFQNKDDGIDIARIMNKGIQGMTMEEISFNDTVDYLLGKKYTMVAERAREGGLGLREAAEVIAVEMYGYTCHPFKQKKSLFGLLFDKVHRN